jgi:aromatic-L-amino-acid/L-tryptophan decarboxylase
MHGVDRITEQMISSVLAYAGNRLRLDPAPLDKGSRDPAVLDVAIGGLLEDAGRWRRERSGERGQRASRATA